MKRRRGRPFLPLPAQERLAQAIDALGAVRPPTRALRVALADVYDALLNVEESLDELI